MSALDDVLNAQAAEIERLQRENDALKADLGRVTMPDGRELTLGVTAKRVEELRTMARELEGVFPETIAPALKDALRFYDLVRLAWAGTIEEYNELTQERDAIERINSQLHVDLDELRAEIRRLT